MNTDWIKRFAEVQQWREAIASVSLSHHPNCTCEICEAARGDEDAFASVVNQLEGRREP